MTQGTHNDGDWEQRPADRFFREKWLRAIRADRGVTGNMMLVALIISTEARATGDRALISAREVADSAGLGDRTVRRHITALKDLGWLALLRRGGRAGDGRAFASIYELCIPKLEEVDPWDATPVDPWAVPADPWDSQPATMPTGSDESQPATIETGGEGFSTGQNEMSTGQSEPSTGQSDASTGHNAGRPPSSSPSSIPPSNQIPSPRVPARHVDPVEVQRATERLMQLPDFGIDLIERAKQEHGELPYDELKLLAIAALEAA